MILRTLGVVMVAAACGCFRWPTTQAGCGVRVSLAQLGGYMKMIRLIRFVLLARTREGARWALMGVDGYLCRALCFALCILSRLHQCVRPHYAAERAAL